MDTLDSPFTDRETTLQRASQQALLEYQAILDHAPLGVAVTRERHFMRFNARFAEMFDWTQAALSGQPTLVVFPSAQAYADLGAIAAPLLSSGKHLDTELELARSDGSRFWCRMLAKAIDPSDNTAGTIFIMEDITERRRAQEALLQARDELERRVQERTAELAMANARLHEEILERRHAEEQVRHLANHDALTGLPNRRLLMDRLEQAMNLTRRHGDRLALLFIDLDCFKLINDRFGHRVGDLILQAVAGRMRDTLREVDTISRVGGDEFVLVLPNMRAEADATEIAQKLLARLDEPYPIDGDVLHVTPSIGISMFPRDASDEETLISRADAAMYRAKQLGRRNVQTYSVETATLQ
jgi:diguanylate cyclase (GGDEF)-like protein/PAS domain S-box-containing protein